MCRHGYDLLNFCQSYCGFDGRDFHRFNSLLLTNSPGRFRQLYYSSNQSAARISPSDLPQGLQACTERTGIGIDICEAPALLGTPSLCFRLKELRRAVRFPKRNRSRSTQWHREFSISSSSSPVTSARVAAHINATEQLEATRGASCRASLKLSRLDANLSNTV